jgi:hypothetical protein
MEDLEKSGGEPGLKKAGLANASTFPGFCSHHDATLFRPIEGGSLTLDRSTAFLFAYRATTLELQRKKAALENARMAKAVADAGFPEDTHFQIQFDLAEHTAGIELGVKDLEESKVAYDEALARSDFSSVEYLAIQFDDVLPLVAASGFLPTIDFTGAFVQDLADLNKDVEHVTLTVTSYNQKSSLIWA